MSSREWFVTVLILWAVGFVGGWSSRTRTADHRYITALAVRHETEAAYYMAKLDDEIQVKKGDIARERKPQK